MAVMVPREKWTDERLDDLNKKVDDGFADVKAEMRGRFDSLEGRFDKIDERFDRMQQTLIAGFAVMIAALVGSTATLAGIAIF
jgi:tetrahydromethanopterin S-methyltransferase subunit G